MSISLRLRELLAAMAWGVPANEWDLIPKKYRAEMIAAKEIDSLIRLKQVEDVTKDSGNV